MDEIKNISILGCGWLGLPLALHFKNNNYAVKGSVTSPEKTWLLKNSGISDFVINFSPAINEGFNDGFFITDVLYINIPPGRKNLNPDYYLDINRNIIARIKEHDIKKVIFISSTSVYPDVDGPVSEEMNLTPDKASGKVLLDAENLYLNEKQFKTTIIRFGGLIGRARNPARFLSGKKDIANALAPVNLIHLDDCIQIIHLLIKGGHFGRVYNACMPEHPTREEFYTFCAEKYKLPHPLFKKENGCKFKTVDSSKLMNELNYSFIFASPFECV